jgi:hypothetical protein
MNVTYDTSQERVPIDALATLLHAVILLALLSLLLLSGCVSAVPGYSPLGAPVTRHERDAHGPCSPVLYLWETGPSVLAASPNLGLSYSCCAYDDVDEEPYTVERYEREELPHRARERARPSG